MDNFNQKLINQVKRDYKPYSPIRINLDTLRIDTQIAGSGNFLVVEKMSSGAAVAAIKLSRPENPLLNLNTQTKIETVFSAVFISNTAQAGEWIDIIIGSDFKKYDPLFTDKRAAQAVITLTHANPNTDVSPTAGTAGLVTIKACVKNTDIAWIDFNQAAVQDDCIPLVAGDSITVQVDNLSDIHANFVVGTEIVWIVNEL